MNFFCWWWTEYRYKIVKIIDVIKVRFFFCYFDSMSTGICELMFLKCILIRNKFEDKLQLHNSWIWSFITLDSLHSFRVGYRKWQKNSSKVIQQSLNTSAALSFVSSITIILEYVYLFKANSYSARNNCNWKNKNIKHMY